MSDPSSNTATANPDPPTMEQETPTPPTFTLQVVSPSVGVTSPLSFPHLPATTTVKQLKAKIRDALPSKPFDESQRLIHRGRMLARDTETMLEVFGPEELANPQSQTLHLVLRPSTADGPPLLPPQPAANPIVVPQPTIPYGLPPPFQPHPRPSSTPANPIQGMHAQQPLPGFQHIQQQQQQQQQAIHQFHQYTENAQSLVAQRLQQLQREAQRVHQELAMLEQRTRAQGIPGPFPAAILPGQQAVQPGQMPFGPPPGLFQVALRPPPAVPSALQNLINQQQRERAADGRNGAPDNGNNPSPSNLVSQTASGRASPSTHRPDHTATYTREGVGPNGERWHVTVNETTTTLPMSQSSHSHHSSQTSQNGAVTPAADIQSVMRNADRFLATEAARNMLQRSVSGPAASQAGAPAPPSGFAGASTPGGTPPAVTTNGFPSTYMLPNPNIVNIMRHNAQQNSYAPGGPPPDGTVVYLLSSPVGPRSLVISNSETFYTPRHSSRRHAAAAADSGQAPAHDPVAPPELRNRDRDRDGRRAARRLLRNQQGHRAAPIGRAPHANPGAGALAAQVGPILWLIVRLVGFVWFFTAGNPSWTRWLMVSGLATIVFIVNTGIFNGVAEQVWGPIRRHLENLIPLAGPNVALVPAANAAVIPQAGAAGNNTPQRRRPGELDPAETAARLLEERRRADEGWLLAQFRRVEHSLLLFLASLVPGVGERHIAAREAEAIAAEAERQRRIEAEDAAANENENGNVGENGEAAVAGENQADQRHNPGVAPPEQPLIEI